MKSKHATHFYFKLSTKLTFTFFFVADHRKSLTAFRFWIARAWVFDTRKVWSELHFPNRFHWAFASRHRVALHCSATASHIYKFIHIHRQTDRHSLANAHTSMPQPSYKCYSNIRWQNGVVEPHSAHTVHWCYGIFASKFFNAMWTIGSNQIVSVYNQLCWHFHLIAFKF